MGRYRVKRIVIVSLFSALIAAGSFIRVPIPPVPITLQTLFVLISGILLPLYMSLPSVLIYLFLGLVGLPLFSGGSGLAVFTGPTGGYLVGMIPAVIFLSPFRKMKSVWANVVGCTFASIIIYIPGLLWLKHSLRLDWMTTMMSGFVPFLPGDVIKVAVAAGVGAALREKADRSLGIEAS